MFTIHSILRDDKITAMFFKSKLISPLHTNVKTNELKTSECDESRLNITNMIYESTYIYNVYANNM